MVKPGCSCAYGYGGHVVQPQEYPTWMNDIMEIVMPYFGIHDPEEWPTSCNLNRYETGGSSVAWHADDEDIFNGKNQDVRILS